MALLSFVQQQAIKPISANNESKFAQLEKEVEAFELPQLLGTAFYQAVAATPTSYTAILDANSYEYNDQTIYFQGLRYVLAYLIYADYVLQSKFQDTFSGFVTKNLDFADHISKGDVRAMQEKYRQIALQDWELIKKYLDINYTDYPLWAHKNDKLEFTPKFYGIKKTYYGKE